MESALIRRLLTAGAVLAALVLGWDLANGNYVLLALVGALAALLVAHWLTDLASDVFLGGLILFGYLVGNRGFAQLQVPGVPLLPAEAVLGVGVCLAVWRAARTKTLPIKRDALNFTLLAWIAVGLARLPYDFRTYGFLAVRDFASVYYAFFFFLAQGWAAAPRNRGWLERCLTAGLALTVPTFAAFDRWPLFFLSLTVAGSPLIYVKSDVAGGFMAAGVFWFGWRFLRDHLWPWLALVAVCAVGVVICNSRASLFALGVGVVGLLFLREWRFFKLLLAFAAVGGLFLLGEMAWPRPPGESSQALRLYESVRSIADFSGSQTPTSADLGDKPDNNRFRIVWWQTVLTDTWDHGRWLGLGFGYDLADQFVRTYYADSDEDFTTRSPHNFLITIFARMGLVGLAVFGAVMAVMIHRTWRAAMVVRNTGGSAPWLFSWMILITACFGVVLEGPMGAVIFWTMLGLANARFREQLAEGGEAAAALQPAEQANEMAVAP
ncbi:MAG TPA: O-antigen ligase family protein [Opitutaceae bacterium]|nr:O-antigen ligase family protein [Lacunisphaera sp.]HWA10482.1 O-antigen ligase family protein [Opitutaceae bacterium]